MKSRFLIPFFSVVIFVLVRFIGIDRGFWQDEYISLTSISNNFFINPFYFEYTTNLPLYFILLKIYSLYGLFTNFIFLRFFGILLSLISIIISFIFLKKYFGLFLAISFSLFYCFLPIQVHYSQEVRPYALTQLLIILNLCATYLFVYSKKYKKTVILTTFLLCLSHYSGFMFSLIFNFLTFFIYLVKKDFKKIKFFGFLLILNLILAIVIFYAFSFNENFLRSISSSTGKIINFEQIIRFPSNFINEGFEKIKEVLSFYYFFGLWYYLVDSVVQFVFKKLVVVFLASGFILETFQTYKLKKISVYWFAFSLIIVLMISGYFLETLGLYPFGGRHIFPYSVIYYFVLLYPLRRLGKSTKTVFLVIFLIFIPLFIFHQDCANSISKRQDVVLQHKDTYMFCLERR